MEMCYGSLDKIVFNAENRQKLTLSEIYRYARGICAGMDHISKENIVHRGPSLFLLLFLPNTNSSHLIDLAARNVLISNSGEPKISDFGMSRELIGNEKGQTASDVGPIAWMAPECMSRKYSTKSDVWAYGCVLVCFYNRILRPGD